MLLGIEGKVQKNTGLETVLEKCVLNIIDYIEDVETVNASLAKVYPFVIEQDDGKVCYDVACDFIRNKIRYALRSYRLKLVLSDNQQR